MWFSFSDCCVSLCSNILWLIAFGSAFPSSLFLLKVHCVCKSLLDSGQWHRYDEVAMFTCLPCAVCLFFPCMPLAENSILLCGLLSAHSRLSGAWLVSLATSFVSPPRSVVYMSTALLRRIIIRKLYFNIKLIYTHLGREGQATDSEGNC